MLHLAWRTRNKKRELQGILAEILGGILYECAAVNEWYIEKLEIQPNYVYMVVLFDPEVSIDAMLKAFKRSDKYIRKEYPEFDEFRGGNKFWANGYFAATQGCYDENALKQYIAECQCEF